MIDLRLPAGGPTRAPVIAVIHGGFWRARFDRTHTGPLAADLAGRGYAVAQLEYRRTGQAGGGWPGTFADVAAGMSLLPALAAEACGTVPAPPLLVGHSAGGQLALWWAGQAAVRGVVALAPVADLAAAHRLDLGGGAVAALLGGGPEEVPHRYGYAQPGPGGAPTVVVHGSDDQQVPVSISRDWTASSGTRLIELPGVEHFGLIDPESSAWPAVVRSIAQVTN